MRGSASDGVRAFTTGLEGGYFVLLDRLYDTLEVRLTVWKVEQKKFKGMGRLKYNKYIGCDMKRKKMAIRLNVAFDICGALKYLHKKDIIFRDFKPQNAGFDVRVSSVLPC